MKTIYEHAIGGDGAVAGLYIEDGYIVEKIKYPLTKASEPAHKLIDQAVDRAEDAIPGDWDKAVLEPIRAGAHAQLDKVLAEI